jgi:hypothetical protein
MASAYPSIVLTPVIVRVTERPLCATLNGNNCETALRDRIGRDTTQSILIDQVVSHVFESAEPSAVSRDERFVMSYVSTAQWADPCCDQLCRPPRQMSVANLQSPTMKGLPGSRVGWSDCLQFR